ncbi:MAG: putative metal-binding motif-containing protein [Patescibacteria group bacterium]|jgi:hypothetical protein
MSRFATIAVLFLGACGGQFAPDEIETGGNDTGSNADADTDADSDSDTDSDTDADADVDTGTNEVPFYDIDGDGREDKPATDGLIPVGMNVSIAEFNTPPAFLDELYFVPYGENCSTSYKLWRVTTVDGAGYFAWTLRSNTGTIAGNVRKVTWNEDGSCYLDDGSLDFWGNLEADNMVGDPAIVPSLVDTYEDEQTHEVKHRMMVCLEVRGMSTIPGNPLACQQMQQDAGPVVDPVETIWYRDFDNDGYGDAGTTKWSVAQPAEYIGVPGDCWDDNDEVHPGATEVVDGLDNDCDVVKDCADANVSKVSEITGDGYDNDCNTSTSDTVPSATPTDWYLDSDGDGFGSAVSKLSAVAQPAGYVSNGTDCDDAKRDRFPGATEIAGDGIDQDCNGSDLATVPSGDGRTLGTWTFTLDSNVSASVTQFEIRNTTASTVVSQLSRSGNVFTVQIMGKTGDDLSAQCWYTKPDGVTEWCASNNHSGKILSATGPGGAYTVGQLTGDFKYASVDSGKRYNGKVK